MQPVSLNTNAPKPSWKDAAMEKAESITEAWVAIKAYLGRAGRMPECLYPQCSGA